MERFSSAKEVSTADGQTTVFTGVGHLSGLSVITDGTNAAEVNCYDGTVVGTKRIARIACAGADRWQGLALAEIVKFTTSLIVVVTGTGAAAMIYYGS